MFEEFKAAWGCSYTYYPHTENSTLTASLNSIRREAARRDEKNHSLFATIYILCIFKDPQIFLQTNRCNA
jgi:hypothetical protein